MSPLILFLAMVPADPFPKGGIDKLPKLPVALAYSADGKRAAIACDGGAVEVYDFTEKKVVARLTGSATAPYLGFGPGKNELVAVRVDRWERTAHVYSLTDSKETKKHQLGGDVSPSWVLVGGELAYGTGYDSEGEVILLDLASGKKRALKGHRKGVLSLASSPDGKTLATGSRDGNIFLWDVPSGKKLKSLKEHDGPVTALRFCADGKELVSAAEVKGRDREETPFELKVWDVKTGVDSRTLGPMGKVNRLFTSPDGGWVVTADDAGRRYEIWDVAKGKRVGPFEQNRNSLLGLAPDGKAALFGYGSQEDHRTSDDGKVLAIGLAEFVKWQSARE